MDQASTTADIKCFSGRLSQVITRCCVSQSEFARRLGVSPGFISDASRGVKLPGAEFLCSVRTVFGVSIDWLLTGKGTMFGGASIDIKLLSTIRLQLAVARRAILDADPTAQVLLLLIRDGGLSEAVVSNPDLRTFLDRMTPDGDDFDLAIELYNGHLWTEDPGVQLHNILETAIAHFEAKKPIDKVSTLAYRGVPVQINISSSQRIAGRDYYEE